jgi:mRNA-degrading endonuclease RelE of RelBE toxin-antitoxin system
MARMRYEILFAPEAAEDLKALKAHMRAEVRDVIERHLRYHTIKTIKARIKRLRGISRPQYRLRVGEIRLFYDVEGSEVRILAIVPKDAVDEWLRKVAGANEESSATQGQR